MYKLCWLRKKMVISLLMLALLLVSFVVNGKPGVADVPAISQRQLLWGDTHLHSAYSPDAFFMQNRDAVPDTAYRYAKGLPVIHPYNRVRVQIDRPLDFLVVSDHAEMMGVPYHLMKGDLGLEETVTGKRWLEKLNAGKAREVFRYEFGGAIVSKTPIVDFESPELKWSVWNRVIASADQHNDPGTFTAFIGWEWSSAPDAANLHRVVFTADGADVAGRFLPFSSLQSDDPRDLWAWLQQTSIRTGADFLAIPHNSNISESRMFPGADSVLMNESYVQDRMRWEPVAEITQIKGDSETHPKLSPNDEFAEFETYSHVLARIKLAEPTRGDYIRSALVSGMEVDARLGVNPYQFGVIGSTDSHSGLSTADEGQFWGKFALDSMPETKDKELLTGVVGNSMSASGLAAVWAESNTRESIFEAFKRKEVYATSGPRIGLRFFGGWKFSAADVESPDPADAGYDKGVPMGSEFPVRHDSDSVPGFIVLAFMDPQGAHLDRVQVIKGWLDSAGKGHERVYDVVWSNKRQLRPDGSPVPVGNSVDLVTGQVNNTIGSPQLSAFWQDPDFDASKRAFYYARAIQIPTARHTTLDAIAKDAEPPRDFPSTIQERAYSSPIWYKP